jgi:hypothetical protein
VLRYVEGEDLVGDSGEVVVIIFLVVDIVGSEPRHDE